MNEAMKAETEHPSRDDLARFTLGTLAEDSADSVADHIDQCPVCEEVLRDLEESADEVICGLRDPITNDAHEGEAACQRMVAAVQAIGREPVSLPQDDAANDLLLDSEIGDYRLLARLGRGGMGTIYKAVHTRLDKVVALKVLTDERMRHAGALARFQREMRAVGKLTHGNIVTAHDAGEANGVHYLVMEFVDGVDCSKLARGCGQMPVADACEVVRQAALGLQFIHENGMVHRDIKPSNLIVSPRTSDDARATVKILDLGLALLEEQQVSDLTSAGQVIGTLAYVAPEQLDDSHAVDIRADIYSLGASLFKLLSGETPFKKESDTPMKLMKAIATESAPSIASKLENLPAELETIVDRMLARDPENRFSTPAEVAAAIAPLAKENDLTALLKHADVFDDLASDTAAPICETDGDRDSPILSGRAGRRPIRDTDEISNSARALACGAFTRADAHRHFFRRPRLGGSVCRPRDD